MRLQRDETSGPVTWWGSWCAKYRLSFLISLALNKLRFQSLRGCQMSWRRHDTCRKHFDTARSTPTLLQARRCTKDGDDFEIHTHAHMHTSKWLGCGSAHALGSATITSRCVCVCMHTYNPPTAVWKTVLSPFFSPLTTKYNIREPKPPK